MAWSRGHDFFAEKSNGVALLCKNNTNAHLGDISLYQKILRKIRQPKKRCSSHGRFQSQKCLDGGWCPREEILAEYVRKWSNDSSKTKNKCVVIASEANKTAELLYYFGLGPEQHSRDLLRIRTYMVNWNNVVQIFHFGLAKIALTHF